MAEKMDIDNEIFGASYSDDDVQSSRPTSGRRRMEFSDDEEAESGKPASGSPGASEENGRRRIPSPSRSRSRSRERSASGSPSRPENGENNPASDNEAADKIDDEEADLFGGDVSSDEEPERRQRLRRPAASPKPEITTSVSVPDIPRFAANSEEVYLARLPNFMNVEHRPFAPDTYDEEDEIARSEATGASTSVSVENTIRWRTTKNPNGEEIKESNARLVRWSDGTFSLLLGGEFFDASYSEGAPHQYLTVQFPEEGIFQAQNRVPRTMMFRPYGVNQLVHKKLTREIARKHQKSTRTKTIVTMIDPEKQREAVEKSEMEKLRARRRLEAKRRNANVGKSGLSERDLEDGSDDDIMYMRGNSNIRKALDNYAEDDFVVQDDEEDDDEEEIERERRERIMRAKRQEREERTRREPVQSPARRDLPKKEPPAPAPDTHDDDDEDIGGSSRTKKRRHIVSSDEDS